MELIKLEMTPKERALAYARGEEVDRIPHLLALQRPCLHSMESRFVTIIFRQTPW